MVRYVPLLKTKAGEITALENLTAPEKDRTFPIFHITTAVTNSFPTDFSNAWTGRSLAVDGTFRFNTTGNTQAFGNLVTGLRQSNLRVLPCVTFPSPAAIQNFAITLRDPQGIVIKSSIGETQNAIQWAINSGIGVNNIDFVLDLKYVGDMDITSLAALANQTLQNIFAVPFRSVTLAAGGCPKDHSGLPRGRSDVWRSDFNLWSMLSPPFDGRLDYGDYGIGHYDLTEPPGYAMANATVSARYTVDNHWIILKGRQTGGPNGQSMATQYRNHATTLTSDPSFGGLPNCQGDINISNIAATPNSRSGNRGTWVANSLNRHFSKTLDQLP